MQGGIYRFVSPSGKCYVGSAKNLFARKRDHVNALKKGTHPNKPLQAAFKKYGDRLRFEILLICDAAILIRMEMHFFRQLHPRYNLAPVAGSMLDYRFTPEQKARRARMMRSKARRERHSFSTAEVWKNPELRAKYEKHLKNKSRRRAHGEFMRVQLAKPEVRAKYVAGLKRYWRERKTKESANA